MTGPDIKLADLETAMAYAPGTRAPLIVWMIDHHDEFAALIAKHRVNWAGVSQFFTQQGFQAANGHTLRPETVRSYWKRARLIVIKQRAATPRPPFKFPKPAPAAPESPTTPPEPKFKFAKMRNGGLGVSAEELRALGAPSAPADPNDPRWQIPPGSKPSGP